MPTGLPAVIVHNDAVANFVALINLRIAEPKVQRISLCVIGHFDHASLQYFLIFDVR